MMNLFIYFAAAYGFSVTLTLLHWGAGYRGLGMILDRLLFPSKWKEEIPADQRGGSLKTLVHCPACTGFWVALGMTAWLMPDLPWLSFRNFETRWMHSVAASGIIWIVHVVLTRLGQYDH